MLFRSRKNVELGFLRGLIAPLRSEWSCVVAELPGSSQLAWRRGERDFEMVGFTPTIGRPTCRDTSGWLGGGWRFGSSSGLLLRARSGLPQWRSSHQRCRLFRVGSGFRVGDQGEEGAESLAVDGGGVELEASAKQSASILASSCLPLAFCCLSRSVSCLSCSISILSAFMRR